MLNMLDYFMWIVNLYAKLLRGMDMINDTINEIPFPFYSVKNACKMNNKETVIDTISIIIITLYILLLYLVYGYIILDITVYPSSPAAIPKTKRIL